MWGTKIGTVVEVDGKSYIAVEGEFLCSGCAFDVDEGCLAVDEDEIMCWGELGFEDMHVIFKEQKGE
jgi:hypothetical protein